MRVKILVLIGFLVTIILPLFPTKIASAESGPQNQNNISKVIISEIKLGGDSYSQGADQPKDPQEFVTLFNQSSAVVDLNGWVLEYAKTTFDKTYCASPSWIEHSVNSSASQTVLSGTLQPGQASTPIIRSLTDNQGGSLHLVDASNKDASVLQDIVGWGATAPCSETSSTTTPSNGKSIKRYLGCNNLPVDTDNNAQDFAANQPPSPGTFNSSYLTGCQQDDTVNTPGQTPQATCEGAILSELLPNPVGSDTPSEFIELYNPTGSVVSLQGCSLQTSGNSKVFNFSNSQLQPGEYHAFYSSETGLTLPNTAGGTVWLLSPSTELQSITYQAGLNDDVSWAFAGNSWHKTYQPTPNATNVIIEFKPCPEEEERSADTGYCHNIATLTTSNLSACKEGQERNPDTNRCRSITSASSTTKNSSTKTASSLAPCKAGQERNPATNRCKAIVTTASASLKPCPAGQERNPSTNRCRKATSNNAAAKLANVKDTATGSIVNNPHWWLAGFAAVGATSYGVYEWRQEVLQFLSKIKTKLPGISAK